MKNDISKQMQEKKAVIGEVISDPKFDEGIIIAEKYDFGIPKFTQNLDEVSLVKYIALLKAENPSFSKMFQELLEWMKSVPQPK
jgi:hypothetical protein